jgi:hypothetical protein
MICSFTLNLVYSSPLVLISLEIQGEGFFVKRSSDTWEYLNLDHSRFTLEILLVFMILSFCKNCNELFIQFLFYCSSCQIRSCLRYGLEADDSKIYFATHQSVALS